MEEVEEVENQTLYLRCPVEGHPPPSIMWLKDGVPLLDFPFRNMRELDNGRQLELRNIQVTCSPSLTACHNDKILVVFSAVDL